MMKLEELKNFHARNSDFSLEELRLTHNEMPLSCRKERHLYHLCEFAKKNNLKPVELAKWTKQLLTI